MGTKKSVKRAVAAHTERLISAGGTRMTIKLSPQATTQMHNLCRQWGLSRTGVIERLLVTHLQYEKLFGKISPP